MNLQLIADAGSSKTDWALTDSEGKELKRFCTSGLNAMLSDDSEVRASMAKVAGKLPDGCHIGRIYYYGAGCATPEVCSKIQGALIEALDADEAEVASDLLGAARSLLGHSRGIACILGTGSNSCLYDGREITHNIPSLGFILGDEGSGGAIGKRLVADALKGHLPTGIARNFLNEYGLDVAVVLERVYRQPAPNKFLASLVPFVRENLSDPYIYSMVSDEFARFLTRNVKHYANADTLPVSFTGSIAYHFSDVLEDVCADLGISLGKITGHPLDGLIDFHTSKN